MPPGGFPALELGVVAARLPGLIAEVFDGFVVEQAVHGAGVARRIGAIGLTHELGAPLGGESGKQAVAEHRQQRDGAERYAVLPREQHGHHADLDQRGHDVENQETQQEAHAVGAALDVACQPAGAPLQMKCEIE